ncbi:uncharacterized protein UV8b_01064 [Ustilaginoidea virens]|uniref:Uncharacterized protein n=1 Tax=Ustilaginoidea virens TaxID=1159556 RepID=A0A8E5HK78_USTVR|nr:uncharacterized protein UV8b_01064 [Ustilaginoidea virens]QUC16823.1 hypothetical protein UV8b_01064 [Ustilaginoidea virens]
MHLLRSIIALATLLVPFAIAALSLRNSIDATQLPDFDAFKERADANGWRIRPIYDQYENLINIMAFGDDHLLKASRLFLGNANAPQYFRQRPTDAGKRPQKVQKSQKSPQPRKGRNSH